jgi:signal transduction histidine kinase
MVKIINARAAGYRLAWIVAVLLIPIVYLGATVSINLRRDLNAIALENIGSEYLNLIGPVMIDAADHDLTKNSKSSLNKFSPAISQEIGLSTLNNNLLLSLSFKEPDHDAVLSQAVALARETGKNSGITYDSDPESYHVGIINSEDLPRVIADFDHLKDIVHEAVSKSNDQNSNLITIAIGNLSSSLWRLESSIASAKQKSSSPEFYVDILKRAELVQKDMSQLSEIGMGMSMAGHQQIKAELIDKISLVDSRWMSDFRLESEKFRQRYASLLQDRNAETHKRILNFLLTSFATVLLGLGSAFAMYRSTLKHLDEVESAKISALRSQAHAEKMSTELHNINDDMVRVNKELANNMQMLKDAQDALVKKGRMEQMGQLTATIAHELRNPLGAVRTSAFLIERKIKGKELGIEPQIARINNGVTRCDDIITQLLDFSRSKKLSCRSENLDKWLEKIVSEEASQLPSAVAIDCLLGMKDVEVPFDPSRLQRAIINLVSNASEAMVGNGEDPSRYAVAAPRITITTKIANEFAVISVKDNGPGIAPENLEKIREPLFTTKSFGTGLGLPAVDQIVIQHGGVLDIFSEPGQGATFTIKLPLQSTIEQAA